MKKLNLLVGLLALGSRLRVSHQLLQLKFTITMRQQFCTIIGHPHFIGHLKAKQIPETITGTEICMSQIPSFTLKTLC